MANQPSKYSKFLVGAASAALVASAVAPVASAADFKDTKGNTHETAINALSDAGVISGYTDGTFLPNKTLSRSDVVKLMGKWLVAEGSVVPTDYKTNPRFSDLKSTSNDELLKYAAVVKDNGVFVGTPDGKLDATGNITRENMAVVLVRAFDRVHEIDLTTYVAGQDFKKDVTDLGKAKAEARPAIEVLDFFDITNPAAPAFNPKETTTRGQFATFLYKTTKTDFSKVTSGVVGSAAVKAVNATTVEVTFKDAVDNINSLNFKIDGLTVSNAAVKQSDNKTVVLTTAVQKGGEKYTVTLNEKAIGSFNGISTVIPTSIKITTQSVQGKVGAQAILSADVGVKQAGIPVTFNVKADTNTTLNKDQVFEAVTNADGIAQFSYTQYAAGTDSVVAYPTGAPAVRSLGYVFWGVDTILTVEDVTAGATVNNGANKTYKVKYLDPKTGKPVAGKRFVVSFEENINVNVNQLSKAKVNNVEPAQLLNGNAPTGAVVITDAKGEATFTVTGENTAVTPIVFEQNLVSNTPTSTVYSYTYTNDLLQAKASKVTFGAVQADYKIVLKRDGLEEAAKGLANGREYTVVVTDKDGKVAKNETVNVGFNEVLDGEIGTQTAAQFIKEDAAENPYYAGKQITVLTNAKGEATFVIGSENNKDYATPIAWIDVNSADANEGKLDKTEPSTVGEITYFADAKLAGAALTTYNAAGDKTKSIDASQPATFKVALTNQSGKAITLASAGYNTMETSFTVYNTGANEILVAGQKVSPNRSYTVSATNAQSIDVTSVDGKSTSVRVLANGVARSTTGSVLDYNFTSSETTATFTASTEVPALYTGVVASYDSVAKTLKFDGKNPVNYTGTGYKYFGGNGATLANANDFIKELTKGGTAVVTRSVDADNVATFSIVSIAGGAGTPVDTKAVAKQTVTGTLAFNDTAYDVSDAAETAILTVKDADLNISTTNIDTTTVAVKDSANKTAEFTLTETGVNTGEFTLVLTSGQLSTFSAGTLTATYVDAKNTGGVQQTITATATLKVLAGALDSTFTQGAATVDAKVAEYTSKSIATGRTFVSGEGFSLAIDASAATPIDLDGKVGAQGVVTAINAKFPGAATLSGDKVVIKGSLATTATGKVTVTLSNVTNEILDAAKVGADSVPATKAKVVFQIASPLAVGEKIKVGTATYTVVAQDAATVGANEFKVGTSAVEQAANFVAAYNTATSTTNASVPALSDTVTIVLGADGVTVTDPAIQLTK
ncbi:S-layer homology domain-containing protein [Sporosarcina sp. E16_8]|uniref:S-layer homology domain-containing protein n=1 Tax=Sporosarcina sp. E16_8 TaxID=2789295 RepID=UPI001A91D074|nr:S-layer homology domain-containing protein [Sporosarcina sp. E16_8]MBO0588976.1 S-layer homology domain-containing protein [Sporosarcina sp. E16_8]